MKLKLRAAKKNMVAIVHQLLTHCFVNANASVTGEETTSTPRCHCILYMYLMLCIHILWSGCTLYVTIILCSFLSSKTNERLWEDFLSVVTVLITEKRSGFSQINDSLIFCV